MISAMCLCVCVCRCYDVDQGFPEAEGPGNALEPDTVGQE
jgi:hypothetical protein